MSLLPIIKMGNPILYQKAEAITKPQSPQWSKLARDMIDTMKNANGIGLAAPQIGKSVRLIIYQIEEKEPRILLNPHWEKKSDDIFEAIEGCLSMPSLRGIVPRYNHIQCQALTLQNEKVTFNAADLEARVIQHECDHLDGILFFQHITDSALFGFEDEIETLIKDKIEQETPNPIDHHGKRTNEIS